VQTTFTEPCESSSWGGLAAQRPCGTTRPNFKNLRKACLARVERLSPQKLTIGLVQRSRRYTESFALAGAPRPPRTVRFQQA
jgi:hypothetical protein